MASSRVRLIDIARKLNLSVSAVSQALRGTPRISTATRLLVEQTARELGYAPDPALSALSAYRSSVSKPAYNGNLAIVSTHLPFKQWIEYDWAQELHSGIQDRATRLGYKVDYFYNPDAGNPDKLRRILEARGTKGLILLPDILHGENLRTTWPAFASIHVFGNPYIHSGHSVASNHYAEMKLIIEQLRQRNYRRPGLFLVQQVSETSERDWLGSFLAHQDLFSKWDSSCLCIVKGGTAEYTAKSFRTWLQRTKPDVLISGGGMIAYEWLLDLKIRIPEDIGYCSLECERQAPEVSGIKQSIYGIGIAAVNQVVSLLHRQELGPVEDSTATLVHGKWVEGQTLRPSPLPK